MGSDMYRETFARNLNRIMEDRSVTQSDIIRDLKVNRATISTWCLGKRMPRMDKVKALAQYLCVDISDLLTEYDPKKQVIANVVFRMRNDDMFFEFIDKYNNTDAQQLKRLMKLYEAMTEDNE